MTLFIYDHCPYCVKARMIFGLKDIPVELVTLLNDDEETPVRMIGKKMLPVLATDQGDFLPESLDIIAFVDRLTGVPIVTPVLGDSRLNQWLQDLRNYHYALAMPRWADMNLAEFATSSAREYFIRKKEQSIGPFAANLERTDELIRQAHRHLGELEPLLGAAGYIGGKNLSLDDFHLFAGLRCLTAVKGIEFPKRINSYMNDLSEKSKVPLHWEFAL